MTFPIDKRYEIIFLSQHSMGPQLNEKTVAKAVKCAKNIVQYWLNRWKESKDWSGMKRPERLRATTEKVDQQISKVAGRDRITTTGDIQNVLKRQNIGISQETIRRRLKEAGTSNAPVRSDWVPVGLGASRTGSPLLINI